MDDFVEKQCTKGNQDRVLVGRSFQRSKLSPIYVQKLEITCKAIFESLGYSYIIQSNSRNQHETSSVLSKFHDKTWTL